MNDYSLDSTDSGLGSSPDSEPLSNEMGEISINDNRVQYLSRSYIEMPQTGEVNYISTIIGVCGNPVYKGKGLWVPKSDKNNSATVKVDKDDIRAKRHYVKTLHKDGREVKIWECGLCGKEFRFQYTLVRHIPTHTDVRNYQCDICPKAFRQLSTLAQHKATHWNMRPFSCDFCQKSFNRISTLISHKKIHYDEKKHVCPFCGKGFHQKGNLRNHMYTHTNERPYKCEICNKGFNQKSNLVCHKISTHSTHRKDHYQCELCNISFGKQNLYTCHMESIHNVSINMSKNHLSATSLWENMKSEPQCAIVDEANNIIYSLPISYDKKEKSLPNEKDNNNILAFCDPYKKKFPVVASIIQKKDSSGKQQVFVLPSSYTSMENICEDNLYTEKDSEDFNHQIDDQITLHSERGEMSISDHQIVVPQNSLSLPAQSINGNEKIKGAIIYTKTQPNIRTLKTKKCFDVICASETISSSNEHMMNADLACSSGNSNDRDNTILIYIPQEKSLKDDVKQNLINKSNSNIESSESLLPVETPFNNNIPSSSTQINKCLPKIYLEPGVSDFQNYRSLRTNNSAHTDSLFSEFPMNVCNKVIKSEISNCKEEKSFEIEVVNPGKQSLNIKKEVESSEILSMDDSCNDIEPTLFINSENLEKGPLSKFNLDFDGENFDILDDYNFTDSFLDNTVNSNESSSIVDTYNPSSPASFIFNSF